MVVLKQAEVRATGFSRGLGGFADGLERSFSICLGMKKLLKLGLISSVLLAALPSFSAQVAILRNGFTIRHERSDLIGANTRLYLGSDNTSFVDVPTAEIDHFEPDLTPPPAIAAQSPSSATSLQEAVLGSSERYRLDPDLVNSVIRAESGFNPRAVSPKGAQGLMQLMPQTATNLGVTNAFDPKANVDGGTRYLRELLERYNFDLVKALAAYNAGPQRVQRYGGVPPYYETRAYIARIVRDFNQKKLAEQKAAQKQPPKNAVTPHPTTTSTSASR
jgi:soluble lytic murein transglycosylase-like protein